MIYKTILDKLGNTPLVCLSMDEAPMVNLYAKLEFFNPTGSVKDRAASYILSECLERGIINSDTTIIESSSGNFGVALAAFCKKFGLKFICVIDPNILSTNELLIRSLGGIIDKVEQPDENGGFLTTRINRVNALVKEISNCYWVNQYGNELNARAYHDLLGSEICNEFPGEVDYLFLGVSSGGTVAGLSRKVKDRYPNIKVIAVDVYGSVIFGKPASKRYIPGIGSSMVPPLIKEALIDDVVYVEELETVNNCHGLLREQSIFAGGSSGSVYAGVKKYFAQRPLSEKVNVVCIFADRGDRYANTIYDKSWVDRYILKEEVGILEF